jgi:hypothetical protein
MWDWIKDIFGWIKDKLDDIKSFTPIGKFFSLLLIGLLGAPILYVLGFALETLACLIPGWRCTNVSVLDHGCKNCMLGSFWTGASFGKAFVFLLIAGTVIGIIYAIVSAIQDNDVIGEVQRKNAANIAEVGKAYTALKNVKNKSDAIVSSIKNAEKTIVSPKAKKMVAEAASEANKFALALEMAFNVVENAKGKSSKGALKNAQQAEKASKYLEKDVDEANDLYNQAVKEEQDWHRLQNEANDAANRAYAAADNAAKETTKIEKTAFASAAAKGAAEKAIYASAKAREAAEIAAKKRDAAAKAASAQGAQLEVAQAKNAEKRAIVEEKIAVEEAKIAIEAA